MSQLIIETLSSVGREKILQIRFIASIYCFTAINTHNKKQTMYHVTMDRK